MHPPPDTAASPEQRLLELSLGRALPCARCRYDLKGLSITDRCPECGLAIQATLLAVVDPRASELQPIRHPRLLAAGLWVWSFGALTAAVLSWVPRLAEAAFALDLTLPSPAWVHAVGVLALTASGLGALTLIDPQRGTPRASVVRATVGAASYVPMIASYALIHLRIDGPYDPVYFGDTPPPLMRLLAQIVLAGSAVVALLGLRSNARLLAGRCLVYRYGRADRQTMAALAAAFGVATLGSIVHALSRALHDLPADVVELAGLFAVAAGWMFITGGLVGVCIDSVRVSLAVLEPPPALEDVLDPPPTEPRRA